MFDDVTPPEGNRLRRRDVELDTTRTRGWMLVRYAVWIALACLGWILLAFACVRCTPRQERAVIRAAEAASHGCHVVQLVTSDETARTACVAAEELAALIETIERARLRSQDAAM